MADWGLWRLIERVAGAEDVPLDLAVGVAYELIVLAEQRPGSVNRHWGTDRTELWERAMFWTTTARQMALSPAASGATTDRVKELVRALDVGARIDPERVERIHDAGNALRQLDREQGGGHPEIDPIVKNLSIAYAQAVLALLDVDLVSLFTSAEEHLRRDESVQELFDENRSADPLPPMSRGGVPQIPRRRRTQLPRLPRRQQPTVPIAAEATPTDSASTGEHRVIVSSDATVGVDTAVTILEVDNRQQRPPVRALAPIEQLRAAHEPLWRVFERAYDAGLSEEVMNQARLHNKQLHEMWNESLEDDVELEEMHYSRLMRLLPAALEALGETVADEALSPIVDRLVDRQEAYPEIINDALETANELLEASLTDDTADTPPLVRKRTGLSRSAERAAGKVEVFNDALEEVLPALERNTELVNRFTKTTLGKTMIRGGHIVATGTPGLVALTVAGPAAASGAWIITVVARIAWALYRRHHPNFPGIAVLTDTDKAT